MRYTFYLALLLFSLLLLSINTSQSFELNNKSIAGTVPIQLKIDANGLRVNCIDQLITISVADQTLDIESYQWFENGVESSNVAVHQHFAATSGAVLFSFIGLAEDGCVYEGEIEIDFSPCDCNCDKTIVPNIFSPDGDGINDVIKLFYEPSCVILDFEFHVINQNSHVVYESNDVNDFWDGTFNSSPAPSDVYRYGCVFTIGDGENCHLEGSITLIR